MTLLACEIKLLLMFGRCTDFQLQVLFDGGSLVLTGIPVGYKFTQCFLLALSNSTRAFPPLFWFNLHWAHELRLIWRLAGGVSSCSSFPSFALL